MNNSNKAFAMRVSVDNSLASLTRIANRSRKPFFFVLIIDRLGGFMPSILLAGVEVLITRRWADVYILR